MSQSEPVPLHSVYIREYTESGSSYIFHVYIFHTLIKELTPSLHLSLRFDLFLGPMMFLCLLSCPFPPSILPFLHMPQLHSAAAANSDNQTPAALGSTLKLLLSDKKPLPGYLPSHSAKHMRFVTPVRRSLRLSLHEAHRTASYETRPCLTSLREVLLSKDEAQRVDEVNAPTAFIFRANELAGSPPGFREAVYDGLVVLCK
uniref:uncharacterized protein n=1 Tax=Myxine glutinosa TaxID=7769 RepID=UPI00358ED46B